MTINDEIESQLKELSRALESVAEQVDRAVNQNKLLQERMEARLELTQWVCAFALGLGMLSVLGITILRLAYHLMGK